MRIALLLLLPGLLAFLAATATLTPSDRPGGGKAEGLAWAGRVFASEQEFAAWLDRRGQSYAAWVERHPGASPWVASAPGARDAAAPAIGPSAGEGVRRTAWLVALLTALAAGGILLVRVCARGAARIGARLENPSGSESEPFSPRGRLVERLSPWLEPDEPARVSVALAAGAPGHAAVAAAPGTAAAPARRPTLVGAVAYAALSVAELVLWVAPFFVLFALILTVPLLL